MTDRGVRTSTVCEAQGTFQLPPVLDLAAAAPLREALLARRGADLDLDAGQVARIGGLCLQVVLAAHRTWAEDGHTLRIAAASDACREAFTLAEAGVPLPAEP